MKYSNYTAMLACLFSTKMADFTYQDAPFLRLERNLGALGEHILDAALHGDCCSNVSTEVEVNDLADLRWVKLHATRTDILALGPYNIQRQVSVQFKRTLFAPLTKKKGKCRLTNGQLASNEQKSGNKEKMLDTSSFSIWLLSLRCNCLKIGFAC